MPSRSATRTTPPPAAPEVAEPTCTRDRIVATATRLFSERGPSAVSVRDLAEAAEVTVPGLYYHFASKAELIQAVYQARGLGRSVAEMTPDDIPTAGPVEARVTEYAQRNFARMQDDEEFLRLMHREAVLGDPDARQVGIVLRGRYHDRWRMVLAGSTDLDPDADLDAAVHVIASFAWGLFVEYLIQGDATLADRIGDLARMIAPSLRRAE
jgi:AcrR family transcriptional regulator